MSAAGSPKRWRAAFVIVASEGFKGDDVIDVRPGDIDDIISIVMTASLAIPGESGDLSRPSALGLQMGLRFRRGDGMERPNLLITRRFQKNYRHPYFHLIK
jgi:hypothetical protein